MASSKEYYDKNPASKAKKDAYNKEFNKKPEQRSKRSELVKANRDKGTYGNSDGIDLSHTSKGLVSKKQSVNRGSKSDAPGDVRARGTKTNKK